MRIYSFVAFSLFLRTFFRNMFNRSNIKSILHDADFEKLISIIILRHPPFSSAHRLHLYLLIFFLRLLIRFRYLTNKTFLSSSNIYVFNPFPNDNWSLNSQFRSLSQSLATLGYNIIEVSKLPTLYFLALTAEAHTSKIVVISHYKKHLANLALNLPSHTYITYQTHITHAPPDLVKAYYHFDLILCMNSAQVSYLSLLGVPSRSLVLAPLALGPTETAALDNPTPSTTREYDAIICSKYSPTPSYKNRKSYSLTQEVVQRLLDLNYKILIVGPNWDTTEFAKNLTLTHKDLFTVISNPTRKQQITYFKNSHVYISLSTLEGGPLPLVDAYIANCAIVTFPTGFIFDLFDDIIASSHVALLNPSASIDDIISKIKHHIYTHKAHITSYPYPPPSFFYKYAAQRISDQLLT